MELKPSKFTPQRVIDLSNSLGKLPPQALDLEEAVLGAALLEKNVMDDLWFMKADYFYTEQHQEIFRAIQDLLAEHKPVDMRTVVAQLRKSGKLELVGGAYRIAELTSKTSSASNAEYHARIIYELHLKRELIKMASAIHHDAYEDTSDVFDMIENLSTQIFDISTLSGERSYKSILEIGRTELPKLAQRMTMKGFTGINTSFKKLNEVTGGWQNKDLIIVAARPGMGKTAFFLSSCRHANVPVGIFSLEMGAEQLYNRLVGSDSEIDVKRIQSGKIQDHEYRQIMNRTAELHDLPIYIDDTPAISIVQLRTKVRKMVQKHKIKMLVVDYLQLMRGDKSSQNREQEISSISRGLKAIAKEFDMPVIALSQLSRSVETRGGDKRPMLSDLRESGAIEQDADLIIFLFRPEYYKITDIELPSGEVIPSAGIAEAIISKHRNGSLETVPLRFTGRFTKFLDYDNDYRPMPNYDRMLGEEKNPDKDLPF